MGESAWGTWAEFPAHMGEVENEGGRETFSWGRGNGKTGAPFALSAAATLRPDSLLWRGDDACCCGEVLITYQWLPVIKKPHTEYVQGSLCDCGI